MVALITCAYYLEHHKTRHQNSCAFKLVMKSLDWFSSNFFPNLKSKLLQIVFSSPKLGNFGVWIFSAWFGSNLAFRSDLVCKTWVSKPGPSKSKRLQTVVTSCAGDKNIFTKTFHKNHCGPHRPHGPLVFMNFETMLYFNGFT